MPVELGVWRIDDKLERIDTVALDQEKRLEDILEEDISIASPHWMVIRRQVTTDYAKYIDLLAIDRDGTLIVLEFKKRQRMFDIFRPAPILSSDWNLTGCILGNHQGGPRYEVFLIDIGDNIGHRCRASGLDTVSWPESQRYGG